MRVRIRLGHPPNRDASTGTQILGPMIHPATPLNDGGQTADGTTGAAADEAADATAGVAADATADATTGAANDEATGMAADEAADEATDEAASEAASEATDVAPRPAEDPDPPTGDPDDERRRGYEPL